MINPELKIALLKAKLCMYLDMHEIDVLLSYSKILEYQTGDTVLQQGKKSAGVYMVLTGSVAVSAKVVGVGAISLTTLTEGNFAGEFGLIADPVSAVSAIAQTNTKCIFIPNAYFAMLAYFSPATKFKINRASIENILVELIDVHKKITFFMQKSNMLSLSMFDEVLHSLTYPKKISLDEAFIKVDQLQRFKFFQEMKEEDFVALLDHVDVYDVPRHCTLIKEGEKAADFYLILRGAVLSTLRIQSKVAKLAVLPSLSIFCGMAFYENMPTIIDFTACERAILLKISAENLEKLKNSRIDVWYYLYDAMCQSWANLSQAADKLDIRLHSELYNR